MRSVLAVIAGLVGGGFLTFVFQTLGHQIFPPPAGMNPMDPESIRAYAAQMPAGAFAAVLFSWGAGAFSGGWLAGKIARGIVPALVVGAIQLAMGIINMVMIPSPIWFWVAGCLLFVPLACLGGKLGAPKSAA